MKELSRRTFLRGAGILGAAALGGSAALVACSPQASNGGTPEKDAGSGTTAGVSSEKTKGIGVLASPTATEEADIVVVGSGIGGFTASMVAKEQAPDAVVVLLEKNSNLGGSTNFAECNGPATNLSDAEARKRGLAAAASSKYVSNSILHYERLREQGDNADWLFAKHGVKWYRAGVTFYEGGNGSSAIKTLTPQAEELGVDIRTDARVTALVTSDAYTVTGVQYTNSSGAVTQLNAKAVILATGGISTNKELLGKYSSQDMEKIIGWGEGQDGDGQLLAEQTAHGRANHLTVDSLFNNIGDGETSVTYSSPLGVALAMQYSDLYINEYGIRFCDESGGNALGTSESGKLIESQGYVFSVSDAAGIARYEAGGCTRHYSGFADACVGQPIDLKSELETYTGMDYLFQADTLKGLGDAIAAKVSYFDTAAFVAEVEKYNGFAQTGTDEAYGKGADYLWSVAEAPFYAFQICSGMVNTSGGIRINREAQVTDARGKVVDGLYAAGVCTSGWDGEVYGGGTCQSVGMWAGSRAARHAVVKKLGGTVASDWMGTVRSEDPSAAPGPSGGDAALGGEAALQ
ncbi:MAG: FAD-binding protein [Coriobacteriales bacterium]|jgi:fumarate reductase flavoprotein subunit|nr:FAD-binding protein [Coriobacteriales bacterium]